MIVYIAQGNPEPVEVEGGSLLDGMIAAQENVGIITWDDLGKAIAQGTAGSMGTRVAVIDLDAAGVRAIHAALWVAHGE
ncbi:hypothetical protein PHILLY_97 [Mycobacterium phage Philly]|uniref:Uncharacterized protein n=4 Tax=Pipefishvirus TaxID=1982899 RepID=V5R9M0_9CAUD|nr:hypothetical protein PHAEDRUS_93 [Mycobacterium phage Phaedrus]YP_008859021.1 hypothetical protein X818_gp095 [Mycobacterium phage Bernardo]YP_009011328.1 hypothetical protein CM02_gp097 [Mycobacterium phage Gadjet]YP_009018609.1 hypothetical protein CM10_gp099 [Mycobacterium phage Akoma]YP_009604486.1 hypothetical protein FDH90_gp100 [Mycobacterium phage Athena]AHN84006.1 hypothetical protein AUDREY_98 [Mycobacterium phage Audrey]QDK01731.1 hypothetical protein RITA1961_99 [Mycobacterium 